MPTRPGSPIYTYINDSGPQGHTDGSNGAVVLSAQSTDELGAPISLGAQGALASAASCVRFDQAAGPLEQAPLNPLQRQKLARFVKNLPAAAGPTTIYALPGGGCAFVSEVPGRVPGSKAVYEKQVDCAGNTTQYWKTTFDPQGNLLHVKDKIHGTEITP